MPPRAIWLLSVLLAVGACAPAAKLSDPRGDAAPPDANVQNRALNMVVRTEGVTAAAKGLQTTGVRGAPVSMFNAGLAILDLQQVPHPYLSESLPALNTDDWRVFPDGRMETTYHLKPGLTWQDGTPLSAEDFVFALQVYSNPRFGASSPTPQDRIDEIRAPDDRTVVIEWTQPYPEAGQVAAEDLQALPRHILSDPLARLDPDAFAAHPFWTREYVGLGPYRIEEWTPGVGLDAVAFRGYVLGTPKIGRIHVAYMDDPNTVLANLLSGAMDVAISNAVPFAQALVLRRQWGSTGVVLARPRSARTTEFQLDPDRVAPSFAGTLDVRVRMAMAHAIDKQAVNDGVFEGQGIAADTRILPSDEIFPAVDAAIAKYPYDLRKSEQLMNSAGFTKGADGIYVSPGGLRFTGEDWIAANPQSETTQNIMLDTWKRAGFEMTSHFLSQAEQREARIRAERPGTYTGDGGSLETLGSDSIPRPENRWTGSNRGSYSSPEYDRLLEAWHSRLDRKERQQAMIDMAKLYSKDLPSIPIHYNLGVTAHTASLTGPSDEATDIHLWSWK
ncbi:MAG TPA: ABC transporter substrate-binding protein [Chloroflexota bacterium]|nr:ABC transporter substrate-binding protein [Chloroflexota bacterium]